MSQLLRVIALVFFLLAVIVDWPVGSVEHAAVLIPAGLAAWVGSTLVH